MTPYRKNWINPQLVVVTRIRPEEKVLDYCKSNDAYIGTGAQSKDFGCAYNDTEVHCEACGLQTHS